MVKKKVKFERLASRIYGICPETTDDKQDQLLKMQLINIIDEKKHFSPNVIKRKLREQENCFIQLDDGQLKISKR